MKKKLLMLLGVILVNSALWAVAPSSYVQFSINGNRKVPGFSQFSSSVPAPYNLGVVYRSPDKEHFQLRGILRHSKGRIVH